MIIFPAIDMKEGRAVRLIQGDMARETVYGEDPVEVARQWQAEGAEYLHLVDLDGSVAGHPVHMEQVRAILDAVDIPCEIGGGIRSREHIDTYLEAGAARVILGTALVADPSLLQNACAAAPGHIAIGIDGRHGQVAVQGWVETTEVTVMDLAARCEDAGAAALIFTDIARDGILIGPSLKATRELAQSVSIPVIASGGVSSLDDVAAVAALEPDGVAGMIIGRALYEKNFTLAAAQALAASSAS